MDSLLWIQVQLHSLTSRRSRAADTPILPYPCRSSSRSCPSFLVSMLPSFVSESLVNVLAWPSFMSSRAKRAHVNAFGESASIPCVCTEEVSLLIIACGSPFLGLHFWHSLELCLQGGLDWKLFLISLSLVLWLPPPST